MMEQLPLAIGWVLYAALHSLLADLHVKAAVTARLPGFAPWYRLAYNGIALLTALPLMWLMRAAPGEELWAWHGAWAWLGNGLALAALFGAMQSSKAYAMNDFLGLGVLGGDKAIERDVFRLSPPHRFVRHPWYSFGLVIVWTRDMNAAMLVSALLLWRPARWPVYADLNGRGGVTRIRAEVDGGAEADRHPRRHLPALSRQGAGPAAPALEMVESRGSRQLSLNGGAGQRLPLRLCRRRRIPGGRT